MADTSGRKREYGLRNLQEDLSALFSVYEPGISWERIKLFVPARESVPVPGMPGLLSLLAHGAVKEWVGLIWSAACSMPKVLWLFPVIFGAVGVAVILFGFALLGLFGEGVAERPSVGEWYVPYVVMAFGTPFALVAVGFMVAPFYTAGKEVQARARRGRGRGGSAPWTSDYPWNQNGMAPDYAPSLVRTIFTFVAQAVFVGLVAYLSADFVEFASRPSTITGMPPPPAWVWVVMGLFDLLAVRLVVGHVRAFFMRGRYGRVRVIWRTLPSFLGEQLKATVATQRPIEPDGPVRATLRCVRDVLEVSEENIGSVNGKPITQKKETMVPSAIYSETKDLAASPGGARSSFDLEFDVPANLVGTDFSAREAAYWQIVVNVPLSGPDLDAVFLAPVYEK